MTESMSAEENAQSGLNEDGEKVRSEERKRAKRVPEMARTNDATDSTSAEANAENGVDGDATESTPEEEMCLEGVFDLARTET